MKSSRLKKEGDKTMLFFGYKLKTEVLTEEKDLSGKYKFREWVRLSRDRVYRDYYNQIVENQTFVNKSSEIYCLSSHEESESRLRTYQCCREINQEIRRLSSRIRIPFCLHVAGYTYEEIAYKLSLQIGVTKYLIQKASLELENKTSLPI